MCMSLLCCGVFILLFILTVLFYSVLLPLLLYYYYIHSQYNNIQQIANAYHIIILYSNKSKIVKVLKESLNIALSLGLPQVEHMLTYILLTF